MRGRTIVLAAVGLALLVAAALPRGEMRPAAFVDAPASIEMFYTPPVLVPSGAEVRIPVDAVCTTAEGSPCSADVTLGTQVGLQAWETTTRPASAGLAFDVTDAAARAAKHGTGSVQFFLRAQNATGLTASTGTPQAPLKFWVINQMSHIKMPVVPFGRHRKPDSALFLPWGSGPMKAGLSLGKESATVGPSAFDVDEAGRIYLLDTEQDRLAVFSEGKLSGETPLHMASQGDLAVAADGTAYVLDVRGGMAEVRPVQPSGASGGPVHVGEALSAHIRAAGTSAFVNLLPVDTWVRVPSAENGLRPSVPQAPFVGRPITADEQLVRVGTSTAVRLGRVSGGEVSNSVEVRSDVPLGEVALAEPDGSGGYWCVVRVWRDGPAAADQYQVLRIKDGTILETFAVGAEQFADTPPLSTFRLGADGDLYQLSTSPSGVRILRFDLGGKA